jgi:hypothetical protein
MFGDHAEDHPLDDEDNVEAQPYEHVSRKLVRLQQIVPEQDRDLHLSSGVVEYGDLNEPLGSLQSLTIQLSFEG